jgi:hypothetical protein
MRRCKPTQLIILAAICVLWSLLLGCSERIESYYRSLDDAQKEGAISRGWIPDFLPASTRAIHEIHNPASPRTWSAFEFSAADSQHLRQSIVEVDVLAPSLREIDGPGVPWWPKFLEGQLNAAQIRQHGFVLYVATEPSIGSNTRIVLLVLNWESGTGYFYRAAGA